MSKVGSIIVLMFFVGFICLAIPRFIAPSANYIQDTLVPPEEPFYFVENPDSVTLYYSDTLFLSASTNRSDCVYSWEYKTPFGLIWSSATLGYSMDGYYYDPYPLPKQASYVYRCKAVFNDSTIYSAPCLVNVLVPSKGLERSEEFEEREKDAELEEFEKATEFDNSLEFENTEVIEEKSESEGE